MLFPEALAKPGAWARQPDAPAWTLGLGLYHEQQGGRGGARIRAPAPALGPSAAILTGPPGLALLPSPSTFLLPLPPRRPHRGVFYLWPSPRPLLMSSCLVPSFRSYQQRWRLCPSPRAHGVTGKVPGPAVPPTGDTPCSPVFLSLRNQPGGPHRSPQRGPTVSRTPVLNTRSVCVYMRPPVSPTSPGPAHPGPRQKGRHTPAA